MTDKQTIQAFINNFRRHFAKFLKPEMGMQCTVHPAEDGGAVLEFSMGQGSPNDDKYATPHPTLADAVFSIQQSAFAGDPGSFTFTGTNYILESGRIVLVKDGTADEWTDEAASRDTSFLLNATKGPQR